MLDGFVPWPDHDAERYRRHGYWHGEALGDLLRPPPDGRASRVALATASGHWSFDDIDRGADHVAAGFHVLGLRAGDRVVVQLPNTAEFVTVTLALMRLGALPVFALPAHRASEITYLAQLSGASGYILADTFMGFDYRRLAREVQARVPLRHIVVAGDAGDFVALGDVTAPPREFPSPAGSDVAFFLLSGGTTGLPKLIPRTHDDYGYQLRACVDALGIDETSVYLAAMPIAHNAALGCPGVLGTFLAGGKSVLASSPAPDDVFSLIEQEGATFTTLMPPLVKLWIESAPIFGVDVSGVLLQIGSAKLPLELARQIRPVLGCEITHWFGMAEGLLTYTRIGEPDDIAFGTTGRPLCPDDELKVVDEAGLQVGAGEIGELLTRGPYTIRGYFRAPEYNSHAFTPDGFLHTGDLVAVTADGNMVVAGRVKDVINRGGEKVSAAELEDHILAHPEVHDVAVIGVPDDTLGDKTCACIIAKGEPLTLGALRGFLVARGIAGYKLPDRLEAVTSFPYTRVGKVNKAELRRQVLAAQGARG